MKRRAFLRCAAASVPLAVLGRPAMAGRAPVFSEHGVAIRGADPVAYFKAKGAVAGTVRERVRWRGAVWLFASRENREAFERDPRRYAPCFGGYCAYTMSQGAVAETDPHAFAIHGGRLYLMRSPEVLAAWSEDVRHHVKLAESHWPAALQ